MSGWVHIGDMSNAEYATESSHLVLRANPEVPSQSRVEFDFSTSQASQPQTLDRGGLYDFEAAKHVFTSVSLALAQLPGQCADATSAKLVDQHGVAATSGNAWWQLTPGRVNVLTTTMSELGPYGNINLNGPGADHDTPLIINVMDAGAVTFGKGSVTQNMDEHTIWNFPNATSIEVSGLVAGTLLAPSAAVTLDSEVRSALIADSVIGGYAVKWDQARPDIRDIACDRGV
jgi:choice-of-anchor A domain-containing protein